MRQEQSGQFYAAFLGGFSLTFSQGELPAMGNMQSKMGQIMLALLKAGDQGLNRRALFRVINMEGKEPERPERNLNQQVYLLRKRLCQLGYPPGKYIVKSGDIYYFTLDYSIQSDTGRLDQLLKTMGTEHSEEGQLSLLRQFCSVYRGEFLPALRGEEWVMTESAYYQKQYYQCLTRLCQLLREKGAYEEMLEFAETASQIHPYDEWQPVVIECLLKLNRRKEALKVYEASQKIFQEELGSDALDQVMEKYWNQEKGLYYAAGALNRIRQEMQEKDRRKGPYFCSLPIFMDLYHMFARLPHQETKSNYLMLCTAKGLEEEQEEMGEEDSQKEFSEFLSRSIRRSDVFTRYSKNQFLIMFLDALIGREGRILERLQKKWQEEGDPKLQMEFLISETEDFWKGEREK